VVVAGGPLSLVRISLSYGIEEHFTDLLELPEDLQVSEVGVFWRNRDKTLHELMPNFSNSIIARDVEYFLLSRAEIAMCDTKHALSIKVGNSVRRLGQCLGASSWAQSSRGFAVPIDNGRVSVYFDNRLSSNSFIPGVQPRYLSLADSGLITAVDSLGQGAIWLPGGSAFKAVRLGRSALGTNAFGHVAAWDFIDGSVKVVDTNTNREWSFQSHDHGIFCTYVLPPGNRLVTCGRKDLRIWTLRHDAPVVVANLPASAFNIARNSQGDLIFDSVIGNVNLLKHNDDSATFLHQHTKLSFSTAWCAERACSGGWDGRVLCTSVAGNTKEVASYGTAIRWITEGAGHCFAAVSNGGIYDVSAPSVPLYRHDREPYRVSVSPSGLFVASVDWGGSLQIWNTQKRSTLVDQRLHAGLIIGAVWLDDNRLITAGVDGYVHLLENTFNVKRSWHILAPVQFVAAIRDAIVAATTDGTLWRISLSTDERKSIPIRTNFTAFAVSTDNVVTALGSEGSEVFLVNRQFEITTHRFERGRLGRISCLMFEDEKTLLACLSDGRVMRIPLDR
jgi:WD40 repeat protein